MTRLDVTHCNLVHARSKMVYICALGARGEERLLWVHNSLAAYMHARIVEPSVAKYTRVSGGTRAIGDGANANENGVYTRRGSQVTCGVR